jgi:hypothetical protein
MFHINTVLPVYVENLGPNHAYVAETKNTMGAIYKQLNDQNLARQLFREAYNIYVPCLGPMHPDTQKAAQDLAQI